jgi:hypothetical protein
VDARTIFPDRQAPLKPINSWGGTGQGAAKNAAGRKLFFLYFTWLQNRPAGIFFAYFLQTPTLEAL